MSRARNVADIMSGVGSNVVFDDGFGLDFGSSVLDDYEEGTYTPSFLNVSVTYDEQIGSYTKIGNVVFVQVYINTASLDTSDGSGIQFNLPFVSEEATAVSFTLNTNNSNLISNQADVLGARILSNAGCVLTNANGDYNYNEGTNSGGDFECFVVYRIS